MESFPGRLADLMRRARVTQVELCQETSLKQATLSRYLRGESEPRISDLQKLATFFRVPVEDLIGPPTGVLEFRDHDTPSVEYEKVITAEEALDKLLRRNKTLYEVMRQAICAVERWDAEKRKRKK